MTHLMRLPWIGPLVLDDCGDVLECSVCRGLIKPGMRYYWAPLDVHAACCVGVWLGREWARLGAACA